MNHITHSQLCSALPKRRSSITRMRLAVLIGIVTALMVVGSVVGYGFLPTIEQSADVHSNRLLVPGSSRSVVMAELEQLAQNKQKSVDSGVLLKPALSPKVDSDDRLEPALSPENE